MNNSDSKSYQILVNLGWRVIWARRVARQIAKRGAPTEIQLFNRGCASEAWNSFQVAKQIYFETGEWQK